MKKKFTFLIAALMLLTTICLPMKAWADTSTVTASQVTSSSASWTGTAGETWNVSVDGGALGQNVTSNYAQIGTGSNPSTSITFTTSGISGTISSIVVNCASKSGSAKANVTVNGSAFGTQNQSTPSWSSNNGGNVTFTGSATGTIIVTLSGSSGATYIKSITVTYTSAPIPTHTATFSVNGTTSTQTVAEGAAITFPADPADINGKTFMGWADAAISGTTNNAPTFITSATMGNNDVTFFAVFADAEGSGPDTYEQLSSNNFDTDATYVIGATQASNQNTMWYFNSYEDIDVQIGWGGMTSDPASDTPIKFTLSGSASALVAKDNSNNYLEGLTAKKFKMSSTLKTVALSATGTILSSENSTWNLRHNYSNGSGGLRWYDGTTGVSAYFYKVIPGVTYSNYCTTVAVAAIAKPTFSPVGGEVAVGTVVTISCTTDGATIYYSTNNGTTWTEGNTYTVNANVTLQAKATKGSDESEVAEATFTAAYVLTVGIDNVESSYYNYYVDGEQQQHWDAITVDAGGHALVPAGAEVRISVEEVEDCYVLQGFTVEYDNTSVAATNHMDEDGTYGFIMPANNATLSASVNQATEYTLTVVGGGNVNFDLSAGAGSTPVTLTNGAADLCETIHVTIANLAPNTGLLVQSVTLTAGNNTTTLTPEYGVYQFNMPSSNATLTFTTATAPTYTLASSIISGKTYIIVGFDSDDAYAMAEQKNSNRAGVSITVDGTTAIGNADVHEVVITALEGDDAGKYTIEDNGYLYAANSSNNQLKTESNLDANGNGKWTIAIAGNGVATITAQGNYTHNEMRFNPNNGNPLFACYLHSNNTTGTLPKIYVKNETHTLKINPYSTANNGWNLIASPVSTTPAQVTNMLENTYDLYRFNQSTTDYWENYKATDNNQQIIHTDFNIVPGQGYLYANSSEVNLSFTGAPYSGNGIINLVFDANAPEKVRGLNLVGNPYATNATVDKDYYIMNEAGSDVLINALNHEQNTVAKMQGVFVKATTTGQTVIFTPVNTSGNSNSNNNKPAVVMNLSQNRGSVIDRAIVRFGNSDNMPKFQLFETNTKLSLVQDNEEYAIVGAEAQGEMPINFKARENGEYTLNINVEDVEMTYLHLIDNMTGADVDLLATPSYTFNARNDDYASRFRLVFSANSNNENGNDNFAFISDGQIILTEQGNVQVYDVMGRMISSHNNVNHFAAEGMAAGVYVIRLTNGNDVMTQKIVVK